MDYKQIVELIKTINKSNIGEFILEIKDIKLKIKQKEDAKEVREIYTSAPTYASQPVMQSQPMVAAPPAATDEKPVAKKPAEPADNKNYLTIKSPMIGTFYRRSAPDKPVLAEVGTVVKPESVVCIIEAMKLFNEIESEVSGKIVKILVEDASPVEFDQPLFLVDPS